MQTLGTELIVNLQEDRPGMLAKATEAIAGKEINMGGCAEFEGILHVLTENVAGARRALEGAGFRVREQPVVVIGMEDRPGVAARIFRRIADAHVNVNFAYLAAGNRLVIGSDNSGKVAELLRNLSS
jgi:hypothetical protein